MVCLCIYYVSYKGLIMMEQQHEILQSANTAAQKETKCNIQATKICVCCCRMWMCVFVWVSDQCAYLSGLCRFRCTCVLVSVCALSGDALHVFVRVCVCVYDLWGLEVVMAIFFSLISGLCFLLVPLILMISSHVYTGEGRP